MSRPAQSNAPSRHLLTAALTALAAFAFAATPQSVRAGGTAATSCADPDLPTAILAGPAALKAAHELRVVKVGAPKATLRLAVVNTDAQRERGLMCVTALRGNAGMIFVFAKAGEYPFWMKNTLIPLDMVWVEADGRVDTVAAKVPASTLDTPDDQVARRSGHGLFVIELPSGDAGRAGIHAGDRLTIPVLSAKD